MVLKCCDSKDEHSSGVSIDASDTANSTVKRRTESCLLLTTKNAAESKRHTWSSCRNEERSGRAYEIASSFVKHFTNFYSKW